MKPTELMAVVDRFGRNCAARTEPRNFSRMLYDQCTS